MSTTTPDTQADQPNDLGSFLEHILDPGSSLHPQFLFAVDLVLGVLLFTFFSLLALTWSLHFLVLMVIVIGLWGSIKFFVAELEKAPLVEEQSTEESKKVQ